MAAVVRPPKTCELGTVSCDVLLGHRPGIRRLGPRVRTRSQRAVAAVLAPSARPPTRTGSRGLRQSSRTQRSCRDASVARSQSLAECASAGAVVHNTNALSRQQVMMDLVLPAALDVGEFLTLAIEGAIEGACDDLLAAQRRSLVHDSDARALVPKRVGSCNSWLVPRQEEEKVEMVRSLPEVICKEATASGDVRTLGALWESAPLEAWALLFAKFPGPVEPTLEDNLAQAPPVLSTSAEVSAPAAPLDYKGIRGFGVVADSFVSALLSEAMEETVDDESLSFVEVDEVTMDDDVVSFGHQQQQQRQQQKHQQQLFGGDEFLSLVDVDEAVTVVDDDAFVSDILEDAIDGFLDDETCYLIQADTASMEFKRQAPRAVYDKSDVSMTSSIRFPTSVEAAMAKEIMCEVVSAELVFDCEEHVQQVVIPQVVEAFADSTLESKLETTLTLGELWEASPGKAWGLLYARFPGPTTPDMKATLVPASAEQASIMRTEGEQGHIYVSHDLWMMSLMPPLPLDVSGFTALTIEGAMEQACHDLLGDYVTSARLDGRTSATLAVGECDETAEDEEVIVITGPTEHCHDVPEAEESIMFTGLSEVAVPRAALMRPCVRREFRRLSYPQDSPATPGPFPSDCFASSVPVASSRPPAAEAAEMGEGHWNRGRRVVLLWHTSPSHESLELFKGFAAKDSAQEEAAESIQAHWRARRVQAKDPAQAMPHALTDPAAATALFAPFPSSLHPLAAPPTKPVPPPAHAPTTRGNPRRRISASQSTAASTTQSDGTTSSPITPNPPAPRVPAAPRVSRPGLRAASGMQVSTSGNPAPRPPAAFRLDDDDEACEAVAVATSARASSLARGYQTLGTEFHTLDSDAEDSTPRAPSTSRRHGKADSKEVPPAFPSSQPSWVKQMQQGNFFESVRAQRSSVRSSSATAAPLSTLRAAVRPATAQRSYSSCHTATGQQRMSPAGSVTTSPWQPFASKATDRCINRPQTARVRPTPTAECYLGLDACDPSTSPRVKKVGTGLLPALATPGKSADRIVLNKQAANSATPRSDAKSFIF